MVKLASLSPLRQKISRNAGSYRGSLSAWRAPYVYSIDQQASERATSQARSSDLYTNDWAANSGINAISTNAIGIGLRPQSHINAKRLGITREQSLELQNDIEAIWAEWTPTAHVKGILHFEELQLLALNSMLRVGETLHLPVMASSSSASGSSGKKIQLALQDVAPSRLRTPYDKLYSTNIIDGVELDTCGRPTHYWIATPTAVHGQALDIASFGSAEFTRIPARVGHRPGCFHLFKYNEDEQVRGESILQPGMNLFRHASDSLDNELMAQVVSSSLAMFIEKEEGAALPDYLNGDDDDKEFSEDGSPRLTQSMGPGEIWYGEKGQKPHAMDLSRPSPNFATFNEYVLRAMAASMGISYEVLTKDFSKTNYSSARAALLEAWRVYMLYRSWITRHYCQPIWAMVIEEAFLRGLISLPAGAPDFYDAMFSYTQAVWIGPARGYVDPVKEIKATVTALENRLMTYSDALAERGYDFNESMEKRGEEEKILAELNAKATPITKDVVNAVV